MADYQDPYRSTYLADWSKQVDPNQIVNNPYANDWSPRDSDQTLATGGYTTTSTAPAPTTKDPYAIFDQYRQQNPQANIQGLLDYYKSQGMDVTRATHANGTLPSDDKLIVNGQMIDFIGDVGGANNWQYNVETPGSGGGGAMAGSPGGTAGFEQFNILDPRANQLYDILQNRATQGLHVDPNDPIIAGQVNAYGAQQQRGVRDYLAAQAEQQGPNSNLGAERRLANEHAAQATGGLQASLMQSELNAQRAEIQNALTQWGAQLSDQQRLALQQKLGQIDANLRQQALNSGNDQFLANLGLQTTNQANYWDSLRSGLL